MTPDPGWMMGFKPADRLALKRAFHEAVRKYGAKTTAQVLAVVRLRYRFALASPFHLSEEDKEHFRQVGELLRTDRIDARAYAAQVIEHEKKCGLQNPKR